MEDLIRKYALENAVKFKGKANPGAIVGKVLAENPDLKSEMKTLGKQIADIVAEVNSLSPEDQQKEFEQYKDALPEKKKEEKNLYSMFDIREGDNVVTAFPPEPSKFPHIGHAKSILLNYGLAKQYNGKFILRFEDTNPTLARDECYTCHIDNYEWLGIKPDEVLYVSSFMEKFYSYCEQLLKEGKAYVDRADGDAVKNSRMKGEATPDRDNSVEENMKLWEAMRTAEEGSHIVRLKIDLKHKNSAMRDPTIMRIIDHPHPLTGTKYRIWPNYDFENSIMDGLYGVTHRLRTKEFELRNELQCYIQDILGFAMTHIDEYARFNLEGVESSGRVIREKIEKGELMGWDDPSLTTLVALKRRGFQAEAVKNFCLSTGVSKSESTLTWDDLIVHNKRILDAEASRYFFVHDAVEIVVKDAPEMEVSLPVHPDNAEKGNRAFKTGDRFFIEREDYDKMESGRVYRLIDCLNFEKKGDEFVFHSKDYDSYKEKGHLIIHFLPVSDDLVDVEVMMTDKSIVKGVCEPSVSDVLVDEVIQFQRFGFVRMDKKEDNGLKFWFTHK